MTMAGRNMMSRFLIFKKVQRPSMDTSVLNQLEQSAGEAYYPESTSTLNQLQSTLNQQGFLEKTVERE